jgi:rhodanese-related sulfurtransferase
MTMMWTYGYEDVKSLSGGFGGWVDAGYPTVGGESVLDYSYSFLLENMVGYNTVQKEDLAVELLEEPPPFIIDVRTVDEVTENGYIPGAVHIPLNELGQHFDLLPSFDTPIVTYCAGGWRATIAMTQIGAAGWSDVRALKATFSEWVDAGYPVDPGLPSEPFVLNAAEPDPVFVAAVDETLSSREGWGVIKADDLNLAITENPEHILIDVRRAEEVEEKGVLEGAIHIPLESFIEMKDQWPADTAATITVYCGSGHRSTMAMTKLWTYGYEDVTSLSGGFSGWVDAGYPVVEYAGAMN